MNGELKWGKDAVISFEAFFRLHFYRPNSIKQMYFFNTTAKAIIPHPRLNYYYQFML